MNILLITTGGTIASVIGDGYIGVTSTGRLSVLEKYREIDKSVSFEVLSPINILSENIGVSDYKAIIDTFMNIDMKPYDGIIVTHGSDTLSYTSAMLGLLFSDIEKPIALVAADKPLQDEKSNGMDNFIAAVEIIRKGMNSVFVPYRNCDGVVYIHKATQILESSEFSDDFYSVKKPYAVFKNGEITLSDTSCEKDLTLKLKDADLSFRKKVMQIHPYPDIDYDRFDINSVKAVIHRSYHAGSVCCTDDSKSSVLSLIKRCKKANVPFYICGMKSKETDYQSLTLAKENGAKIMYDVSPACLYMKLMLEG